MNMKTLPWLLTGVTSIVACVGVFSGCSSDTSSLPAAQEAGAGGSKSTGGHTSSSGGSSTAGASGASGAANSCTVAVSTTCDGKEDCPAGQRCCGTLSIGGGLAGMGTGTTGYTKFGCYDTCALPDAGGGGDAGGGLG